MVSETQAKGELMLTLHEFRERCLNIKLPQLKKMDVDCKECGETMFTIDRESGMLSPISMICEKCRKRM